MRFNTMLIISAMPALCSRIYYSLLRRVTVITSISAVTPPPHTQTQIIFWMKPVYHASILALPCTIPSKSEFVSRYYNTCINII